MPDSTMHSRTRLGVTLVTGGCGFLGYHLVAALLKEPGCGPIHVLSRNPKQNLQSGVQYRACDLTKAEDVTAAISDIKPKTVFHAASPASADPTVQAKQQLETNINGTANLLNAIRKVTSVQALIFSSTVSVMAGSPHLNLSEEAPYNTAMGGYCTPYYWGKTVSEQAVLNANQPNGLLKTTALRLCLMYGERDNQSVPGLLPSVYAGQTNVQMGDNSNCIDTLFVGNAAQAHLLAARALLDPAQANGRVDGEAFNVTDGNPIPFWDYVRMIYCAAGDKTEAKDITVIPAWAAWAMASTAEWAYWIGTLGRRKPAQLNKLVVIHCVHTYTYDISKIRRVLGFNPHSKLETEIPKAVKWEMQRQGKV